MTERHDCDSFQRRLDERPLRDMRPEEFDELLGEAARCPECAAILRTRELLDAPSTGELEAEVPDLLVRGMWPRVREAMRSDRVDRTSRPPSGSRAIVPVLSAAVVVLALGVGLLAAERARLVERQSALTARLVEQERRLAGLERAGGAPVSWTARLGDAGLERVLRRRDAVTVGEIRGWLGDVPPGTTLIGPDRVGTLDLPAPPWTGIPSQELRGKVDASDGLQAGELLDALNALGIPDDESIPTRRLIEIYRATL